MSTAKAVMEVAQKYVGTKEVPAGSNNVIFNSDYYGRTVSGDDYPWCCSFVWDVFRMADASELFYGGNKTAYCPTYESWALGQGLAVDKNAGEYGDVATMDFGKGRASHIGFILARLSNGMYQTIEGNTSASSDDNGGAVMVRTRSQNEIRYIFRPKYKSAYLSKGDEGSEVIEMQAKLIALGFSCGASGVDGKFGKDTEKALVAFQKDAGIEADGKYGPQSKAALERKYNEMAKFTRDQWIAAVRTVYLMAHNNGYTYGDSTTTPPCAPPQKLISCDRLEARALWDLGLTDQRKGGEVCSTFPAWFAAHGAKRITDRDKLEGGDIIFVDDGTGGSTVTWKWHMFTIVDYDRKTGMCHKYDCGSTARIRGNQPFYVQLEEWGTSKRFRFAYRMPYAGGPLNGTYRIESSVDRDYVLDVSGASTADKANIQIYKRNGTQAQTFNLEYVVGGYYQIINIKSGKAVDVSGAKIINKRNIWQYTVNGTKAQLWKPIKNPDGSYTFESALKSDYVMDLSGAKAVNKRNVHLYKKNGTNAQKWFLVKL